MLVKTKESGTRVTDAVLPNLLSNREMAEILVDQLPLYCDHCLIFMKTHRVWVTS